MLPFRRAKVLGWGLYPVCARLGHRFHMQLVTQGLALLCHQLFGEVQSRAVSDLKPSPERASGFLTEAIIERM